MKTFEQYALEKWHVNRGELRSFIKDNPTRSILLAERYAKYYHKAKVNSIIDEAFQLLKGRFK